MPRLYTTRSGWSEGEFGLGRRLYRIFLLAILFGVLWVKGFLWSAFIIALVLYLYDAIVVPALAMQAIELAGSENEPASENEPVPQPPPRRGRGRGRWKWPPEE